jgi:DNA polymerase III subunit delta
MALKKAHEVDAWIAHPDPRIRIVLIYGPDRGLVSERAQLFAAKTGISLEDPFSVVKLDAAEIEQMPGRLLDEARMVPMFARERLIWMRGAAGQKGLVEDVQLLLAEPPPDALILIEASDLKKNAPLRTIVEGGNPSMALPCYADDGRGIDGLIDDELGSAGLAITLEARQALRSVLGGDRLATRGELQKLALFSRGRTQIGLEDVKAAVGDVAALSSDEAVDAVLAGNPGAFDHAFSRTANSGAAPAVLLGAALRQFQAMQIMRESMDAAKRTAAAAVAAARPPIFFSRRRSIELALQRWPAAGIARAVERLQGAVLETRRRPELHASLARQALLALTLEGARLERDARGR